MAALPLNFRTYLIGSAAGAQKRHLQGIKGNWAASNNYARGVSVKAADEPSAASARAVDKVLMTPGPVNTGS